MNFVNLHLHSEYSLQDSVIQMNKLAETLRKYNQNSVALTDHSSTAGWFNFNNEMNNNNIKPIFGNEFYMTNSYEEKSRKRYHLVCLAKNNDGVRNIRKLQRIAVENFYYKPLLSYEDLYKNKNGIVVLTACSLSKSSQLILDSKINEAKEFIQELYNEFQDDLYIEYQFHPLYKEQSIINEELLNIMDELSIPPVVTCDSHFLKKEDADVRKMIQAIAWHKKYNDISDSLPSNCLGNKEIVINNAEESNFSDMSIVNKAIHNTVKISDKCNPQLEEITRRIPSFTKEEELRSLFNIEWG